MRMRASGPQKTRHCRSAAIQAPPSIPANLQGTAVSTTQINLSWSASTDNVGVTGYELRRDGVVVASPVGTSVSDTGLTASTSYVYTIAARDAAGNVSANSTAVSVTTLSAADTQPPSIPTNLQGTAVSPTRIDLTWSASTDNVSVTGYELRRDGVVVTSPVGTSVSDTGLTANTSYVYTIAARDAAGNVSANSTAVSVTTLSAADTQPPSIPTSLQGTAVSTTQINLSWSASTDNVGVTGYELRRDGVVVTSPVGTSVSDTGLTANTSYVYTIAARDAAGNVSANSTAVTVTTLASADTEAPSTPTNLQGMAVSPTRIDLTWSASTDNVGVTGYELRRDGVVVASPVGTSVSDTGLTANTSYVYTLPRATRPATSPRTPPPSPSPRCSALTPKPPSDTGNLQGTAVSPTRIDLTWSASTDNVGITGYELRRDGVVVASPVGASVSDTGLTANTSYVYTVAARDAAGNVSANSTAVTVTTLARPTPKRQVFPPTSVPQPLPPPGYA